MSTTITVTHLDGSTEDLPSATPVYAESWEQAHAASSGDGSMAHISDLVPCGTLADLVGPQGASCPGRDPTLTTWFVEDLSTGDDRICVAIDSAHG